MMQWIDAGAAPLLVLLLLAAAGGFFVHERWRVPVHAAGAAPSLAVAGRWALLSVLAALAMAWMTWNMAHEGEGACRACIDWRMLDGQAQWWIQAQAQAWWMPGVQAVTQLGYLGWMVALGGLASLWLLLQRAWLLLGTWVLGVAGVGLWVRGIKHSIARERPEVRWVLEQGYSFPSGHSAGTLVCYGLLAWLVRAMAGPVWGRRAAALALGVVLAVGASRILLGAHYVSDVLAGWLLGLAWMAAVLAAADVARYVADRRRR